MIANAKSVFIIKETEQAKGKKYWENCGSGFVLEKWSRQNLIFASRTYPQSVPFLVPLVFYEKLAKLENSLILFTLCELNGITANDREYSSFRAAAYSNSYSLVQY